MIHKNTKNQHAPNNFRPISLTSNLSKLFERIINSRLHSYLWHNDIITNFQAAYRNNIGTHDQIYRFKRNIFQQRLSNKTWAANF